MKTLPFCDPSFTKIPVVMTIGVFDGLHLGHMEIMRQTLETARELNARTVVVTFSVNPKMFCGVQTPMKDITSYEETENILSKIGIDYHCVIDFSTDISKLTGEEFIAKVCTSYDLRAMVVGDSFRCGSPAGSAGPQQMKDLLSKYTSDAVLKVVPPVLLDGETVSSSLIRRCLLTGDLDKASRLLGRPLNLR